MPKKRIICGNAQTEIPKLDDQSIDVCFTSPDPPENENEVLDLVSIFGMLVPKLKDTGSLWVQLGDYHEDDGNLRLTPHLFAAVMKDTCQWICRSDIIWHRPDNSKQADYTRFKRDCEHIFWFTKKKSGYHFDTREFDVNTSLWTFPYVAPEEGVFESGFPIKIITNVLELCSIPGYTVLDPLCGTGTTGEAALMMGCNFIGIDKDVASISKINKRLNSLRPFVERIRT